LSPITPSYGPGGAQDRFVEHPEPLGERLIERSGAFDELHV